MFRSEMNTRLPNTLMLEAFLRRNLQLSKSDTEKAKTDADRETKREEIISRVVARLEEFTEKFRDGQDYRLFADGQLNDADVRASLAGMNLTLPDGTPIVPAYISREKLLEAAHNDPIQRRRISELCDLASRHSLRHSLDERHLGHLLKVGGMTFEGRDLFNLVGLSLGSQRLLEALDVGFGYSFAHIFKDDIVGVWVCYVGHALLGDTEAMTKMEPFMAVMRRTFPVAFLSQGAPDPRTGEPAIAPAWIFMVS